MSGNDAVCIGYGCVIEVAAYHDVPVPAAGNGLGYAVCFLQETEGGSMAAHKTLYLDDLCVDETSRKQGVGHALFAAVEALAREQGCYDLTLNVWEGNDAARAFYDHLGMKPLKTYLEKVL